MTQHLDSAQWRELVSRLVKSEMSKRKMKYDDLSRLLAEQGTQQSSANLRNKINRGIMGADLFVQLLLVLNVKQLERDSILDILHNLND
ncbi:MAG: DUF6471 domain-containing protein [Pseudomonadales bacterium]